MDRMKWEMLKERYGWLWIPLVIVALIWYVGPPDRPHDPNEPTAPSGQVCWDETGSWPC